MDWQAVKKAIWEQITFSSVTKTLWGVAGTLIAIYWKRYVNSITKVVSQFFKRGATILSLQSTILENTGKVSLLQKSTVELQTQIAQYRLIISELEIKAKENNKQVFIANSKQMALAYCASDPIFINNANGEVIFVNPAWLLMTGLPTAKDAFGFGFYRVIHPDNENFVKESSKRLIEHPSSFENYIIFRHYNTFAKITTICRSEPIVDDTSKVVETVGRISIISVEEVYKKP